MTTPDPPVIDRSAACAAMLARHRDPSGPRRPGMVATRWTDHGPVPALRLA